MNHEVNLGPMMVFGATGYTGQHVVRALRSRHVPTVAHIRPDSPTLADWRDRFGTLGAEISECTWTPSGILAAMRACSPTVVFALLGTTKKRARLARRHGARPEQETYEHVDRDLTLMLLDAACELGAATCFVYLSALGARTDARLPYLRVRGEVHERLEGSGLPYVIAEPAFITGPDRSETRPMERMGSLVLDGVLGAAAAMGARRPRARLGSISGADLANALVSAALASHEGSREVLRPEALRAR